MEAPRLVFVGVALPPPPRPLRHRHLPPPRGAKHRILFSRLRAPRLAPPTRCSYSRKGKDDARGKPRRESSSTFRIDVEADNNQGTGLGDEQSGIWELFSKAQRNILYLNKDRLVAMEELKKLQDENKSLLQEIEVLEMEMRGILVETTQSSSFCELLLRIDALAISRMIDMEEASGLRKEIVKNQNMIQSAFSDIHHKPDSELLSELRLFLSKPTEKPLHVVHICSEMDPVASCGSLATYVAGLSCALQRKGNLVEVILPNTSSGVGLTLIEPVQLSYFNREMLRGYPDDFERFSYFSRASLDYILKSGKQPDILHIHNWETAIVGPLFWDIFAHRGLGNTRILLSCQDLNSQCLEEPSKLELCGLDPRQLHRPDRLQDTNNTNLVNVLKGGIVYSNKVVLISPTNSRDVLNQGLGHGLEATLTTHKEKVLVASHGLDGELWDPSKDMYLPQRYSAKHIEGKYVCRKTLKRRLGFHSGPSIIIGCICDGDSVIDNLRKVLHVALHSGAQVIFMENKGSVVNSTVEALKEEIKFIKQGDKITFIDIYDETLAHLIFAGSDIIMCSSFHDPSLQIAMRAIKYGSAPVQINTPVDGSRQSEHRHYHNTAMYRYIISTYGDMSLSQALDDIKNEPSQWERRNKDGMAKGLSWEAECYDIHWEAYSFVRRLCHGSS